MWGKKISRLIHDLDRGLALGNPDVDVQPKNEIGPGQQPHVLDDRFIALAFGDELIVPMRKRMRAD